ncbi:MAG: carboxypeptidase regulatory-like domain-containing protein, partial [Acidobacteriaceae bacterium]|nr:carboxypeptidase regulatory-like domain-containing protein [Acidobacteriaceae bacterium]
MIKLRTLSVLLGCSFLFALLPIRSNAQSDVGSIVGFVRDPSQATVPGAKVVIKNEGTGDEHTVTTDAQGHYIVTNLLPGYYTMTTAVSGFKK